MEATSFLQTSKMTAGNSLPLRQGVVVAVVQHGPLQVGPHLLLGVVVGAVGGQPFNASAFLALQACDIVRQRAVGITGQMKLAYLAEGFGVDVHGGNPHVILAIKNDPIFEAVGGGPLPKDVKLTFQGQMVVEDGYMYIAYGDEPVKEPDWDEIERNALMVI